MKFTSHIFAILVVAVFGWSGAYLLSSVGQTAWRAWQPAATAVAPASVAAVANPVPVTLAERFTKIALGTVGALADFGRAIPADSSRWSKEIHVDLEAMTLTLYQDGIAGKIYTVLSKGRPGSPWETPGGEYKIESKERNHFSSIGKVWMPYSMQFFGNFFIHGWPNYADGRPVGAGYSGGCVRLSNADAKEIFEFADHDTRVVITNGNSSRAQVDDFYLVDPQKKLGLSAKAYLVADMQTGTVIAEKNKDEVLPLASISKLVTTLTSLEAVNQFNLATVSAVALSAYGESGFAPGERIAVQDLLYPLLLESSNDAAEVLANQAGHAHFIDLMNKKALAIGLASTSFEDPSGISPHNVSTATDLFKLLRYLYEHKQYVLSLTREKSHASAGHLWENNNLLVNDARYLGGKTGKTEEAGETLAALFSLNVGEFEPRPVAVIILGSANRQADTTAMLKYVADNVYYGARPATPAASPLALAAVAASQPVPEPVTLTLVGDVMLDRGVRQSIVKYGAGDPAWLFENMPSLRESDILFGNLEGPASDQGVDRHNLYSFRMTPDVIDTLKQAGFDALSVANNHIGDWGRDAFVDTLARLRAAGIVAVGGGASKPDAATPKVITVRGERVGFLGFTDVGPDWLAATGGSAGVLLARDKQLGEIIKQAASSVDALVVSFHFGKEYQTVPTARQRELAQAAIEAGALVVAGHHPHVVQPVERYKGGVIAYSLGNFIFDQNFSPETMQGLALTIKLDGKKVVSSDERRVALNSRFQPSL